MSTHAVVKKRRVVLHGHLAEKFGAEFNFAVRSPAEAIRLFLANFKQDFADALSIGEYHVIIGEPSYGLSCNLEMSRFHFPEGAIHFVPVIRGAGGGGRGKGTLFAIIGAALMVTAIIASGGLAAGGMAGFSAAMGTGATIGGVGIGVSYSTLALLGAGLMFAGISVLLTPTPKSETAQTDNSKASTFFSGAINITKEGTCVPLVYGRITAGCVTVSGGLFVEVLDPVNNSTPNNVVDIHAAGGA